jgi:hypothetical protein
MKSSKWLRLDEHQAHRLFKVPWYIASKEGNVFFSTGSMPGDPHDDGPWPLIALLQNRQKPSVVTFQICTVQFEFLYDKETPNPLDEPLGGYLLLRRQEFLAMSEPLQEYAERWPTTPVENKMFQLIAESRWPDFNLNLDNYPRAKRYHYLQLRDPLDDIRRDPVISLVNLSPPEESVTTTRKRQLYGVDFRQFSSEQLEEPSFTPLDDGLSRLELDKGGCLELASLMRSLVKV